MDMQPILPDSTQTARLRALLRSHSSPPAHLASTISALSDELARHENEILRLRTQLEETEANYAILKEHYGGVRSLLAPIRRLPSEVLVQIFEECEGPKEDPDSLEPMVRMPSLADDMERLARKPLLTVSQVCTRWHEIVLGKPTFWDNIDLHSIDLWRTEKAVKKALSLLKLAPDRGRNTLLTFGISIILDMDCAGALRLLAQHCKRWKMASFYCSSSDLQHLRGVKGKLPLLEALEFDIFGPEVHDPDVSCLMGPFEVAPRLTKLSVGGLILPGHAVGHLDKLHTFECLSQQSSTVAGAISFMSGLPSAIEFHLQISFDNWEDDGNAAGIAPSTSSDILSFSIDVWYYFEPEHCVEVLTDIFTSLTLSRLRTLKFRSRESPFSLISFPHSAFMDLAKRSAFQTHLLSLGLCDVVITEAELVEVLAVLPLLQHLKIADHQIIHNRGANMLLITDSLFSLLTLTPEPHTPRLVPHLQSLHCQSLLQFDDHIYLNFLFSRRRHAPSELPPFVSRMCWRPGYRRALDPDVAARIRELCIQKQVVCNFCRAALW
ncbi:hypothetical protein B0H13DRAFT_2276277 [Mycena leptocephala]|nr:hypothetical protein B0H13DRAFT_2276277 [Mycena leptocephala]